MRHVGLVGPDWMGVDQLRQPTGDALIQRDGESHILGESGDLFQVSLLKAAGALKLSMYFFERGQVQST
jgi:hypothetical protein